MADLFGSTNAVGANGASAWNPSTCPRGRAWNFASQTAGQDVCNVWCGVTCGPQLTNIVALNLQNFGLQGAIPSTIAMLSALTSLQMSQNLLSKTIPEQMMRMTQLQTLDLSTNVLTGTLPAALGTLTMLRVFKVSNNGIKGAVPNSYCNLVSSGGNLQTFDITGDGAITCFPNCMAAASSSSTTVLLHDSTVGVCGAGTNRNPGTVTLSNGSDQNTVAIAGGIAGGIVFLVCVVGCVFLAMRSRYSKSNDDNTKVVVVQQQQNPAGKARRPTQASRANGSTPPRDEEVGNPMNAGRRASTRQSLKPLPLSSGPGKAPLKPFTPQMQQSSHNRGRDDHEEEDEEEEEDDHGDHFSSDAPRGGGGGGGWRGRDDDDISVGSEVSASGGPAAKRFTFNTMGALSKPSEGPPSRGQGQGQGQGQGHGQGQGSDGEGSEGERSGSEYGSDGSEGENKLERPGGPGQEQRFMLGINPMAGRGPPPRLQPHPHSDSSHQHQQQGQGVGHGGLPTVARPVAPNPPRARAPGDPAPPRGVGGAPNHMSIRPEMQQAALGKHVGGALLSGGGMLRPPPPPRPPGQR